MQGAHNGGHKGLMSQEFWKRYKGLFEAEKIQAVIDCVYPWQAVAEAHRYMEANKNTGKIILEVD